MKKRLTMKKGILGTILNGSLIKDLGNITQIFKDNKGRFSSKRTVAGALVAAGIAFASELDPINITLLQVVLPSVCFITAGAIVLFAPTVEKFTKDEYPEKGE